MVARAVEETGLPTVTIVLVKEHAQRVKPPRALFVPFPYGFALGNPGDPPFQHKVLGAALELFAAESAPVLAEFPEDGEAPVRLLQAIDARKDARDATGDPADEVTALRGYYERWTSDHDGRTQVGLAGVDQHRFRGLIRYMQSYQPGQTDDYAEKPSGIPTPRFLRLASDDLKAFYFEARMCQNPGQKDNDLQKWFWAETAMGTMLAELAERLNESGDEELGRAAFGIAR